MTGPITYPAGQDKPIASAARYLLETIVNVYAEQGIDLPTRQVITIGSVAVDGPVLAVMYGGITVGPPGNEMSTPYRGDSARTLTFNVELWRETPVIGMSGSVPPASAVTDAAEATMEDSWWLMESAFASDQMGIGIVASATVNEPQGGMVGVSMMMEMVVP